MNIKELFLKFTLFNICLTTILRIIEYTSITISFGYQKSLFSLELFGLLNDLIFVGSILLISYPVFNYLLLKLGLKTIYFFVFISSVYTVIHLLILSYFLYQLEPLDTFLYRYPLKDILFTLKTSGLRIKLIFGLILVFSSVVFFAFLWIKKYQINLKVNRLIWLFLFFSLPIFLTLQLFNFNKENDFYKNKSLFFILKSITYIYDSQNKNTNYSNQEKNDFRNIFIKNSLNNNEYPLLHKMDDENVLKSYFKTFDGHPNIVFLIVEGLNDDFIHPNKEINLMPFLSKLKDSSLYWEKCFTLGERSFAAVPSLLGSLPYGKIGFTLQEKFPRHVSLVSILKGNNYKTSFFYGQPSWFHNKYNFFNYNHCDYILDNSKFSSKYKKIIVGKEKYFWGYDDKSLFDQAHEILEKDSVKKSRLDIYFTGSMHSPFMTFEDKSYQKRFLARVNKIKDQNLKNHYYTYKRFYKSLLFTDDALKDFFKQYQQKAIYKNTLFIITGDHPMTEIPSKNLLKRFHVPLIIYSPKLLKAEKKSAIVSHLDVYETILSFLSEYKIKVPKITTSLGNKLIVKKAIKKHLVFMNDNRELIDYYSNGYYMNDGKLFKVKDNFDIVETKNEFMLKKMKNELNLFIKNNNYVCQNDKIIPEKLYCKYININKLNSLSTKYKLISEEYFNLQNKLKIANEKSFIDLSFDYEISKNAEVSIVYTLSNEKDSLLSWKSFEFSNDLKTFQQRFILEKQNISHKNVFLKVYLWNKNLTKITFKNLKLLTYH